MRYSLPVLSVLLLVTISVTCADPFSYKIDRIPNNDVIRNEILIATPSPAPNQETSHVTPTTTSAPTTSSSTEAQSVATQTTTASSSSSSTEAPATTAQNIDAVVIVNAAFENLSITTRKLGTPTTTQRPRPSAPGLASSNPKPTRKPKPSKKPTTTRKPRPEISATAPVDCNGDVEFWPHEECNKFIWCLDGEQVIQSCPGNLYWDFKLEKCGWPNKVDKSHCIVPPPTVNSPITTTTTTTTPVPPQDCDSEDEYFAHPDCDKYIWCVHGEPQTFACPGDLYWDNEKEECGWRKKVPSSECNAPVKKNL